MYNHRVCAQSRLSKSSYWVDTFENWGFKIIQKLRQKCKKIIQ